MQLTKWSHSCVTLTRDDRKLVLDPGTFSETGPALDGASAVLVTHEHADHLDADALQAAMARDDALTLHAPAAVAERFAAFGERVTAVRGGEAFEAAGFGVRTFGDQHALIHPRVPMIANVGYLVDDVVFHPGDSFTVPPVPVDVLLLPISAPWAKIAEVIDYAVAVRPPRVLGIHEQVYSEIGRGMAGGHVSGALEPFGSSYELLPPGSDTDVRFG